MAGGGLRRRQPVDYSARSRAGSRRRRESSRQARRGVSRLRPPRLDPGLVRPRGASSRGRVVAHRAKSAQPLPRSRSAKVDDYDRVGSTSREHIENFGEGKQLVSDFMHPDVAIYDVNLVGLQRILPASTNIYYGA
jgi:hypothetical protein